MYQIKNSKSKNQIKLPREKNRMHAQLSHAKQNYDLDIGQNQPAVSEKKLFSRQLVRSKIKNKFCCEVKHNNNQNIDQTKKLMLELLAWAVIKIITKYFYTLWQIKIIVQNKCSRNIIPCYSFKEVFVSNEFSENVQPEASNQKESKKSEQNVLIQKYKNQKLSKTYKYYGPCDLYGKPEQSVLIKKYKKQLSLSIYKYYDLCYLYELYKINEGKYFHTARIKLKILGKRFRYCAKHHDNKTGKYVYPNSLPPPQRVSKTGLSYQVKIHLHRSLEDKIMLVSNDLTQALYRK